MRGRRVTMPLPLGKKSLAGRLKTLQFNKWQLSAVFAVTDIGGTEYE